MIPANNPSQLKELTFKDTFNGLKPLPTEETAETTEITETKVTKETKEDLSALQVKNVNPNGDTVVKALTIVEKDVKEDLVLEETTEITETKEPPKESPKESPKEPPKEPPKEETEFAQKLTNVNPNGDTVVKEMTSVEKDVKEDLVPEETTKQIQEPPLAVQKDNVNPNGDTVELELNIVTVKDLRTTLNHHHLDYQEELSLVLLLVPLLELCFSLDLLFSLSGKSDPTDQQNDFKMITS